MSSSLDRRSFNKLVALGGAGATLGAGEFSAADASSPPDVDLPNIVFIMADDLGMFHLSCYGQEKYETPNIDRLAEEGMMFHQAYAGCTVCAPSRSALMSGKHIGHAPVRGNTGGIPLRDEDVVLPELLKEAGYENGYFGKWGLGEAYTEGEPNNQGVDDFLGYLHQIHAHFYYPTYLWKNGSKWPLPGNEGGGRLPAHAEGKRTQYVPEEVTKHAEKFIRANADRPFFCMISSTIPHTELAAPPEEVEEFVGRWEEEPMNDPRPGYNDPEHPKSTIAAMITHMDTNVGKVLDLLDELDLADDTLVIFTSDNGPHFDFDGEAPDPFAFFEPNGPFRGEKRSMYEGGIRVPALARWPGKIEAGSESDHIWYFPDVMPTLLDLTEVDPPEDIDGVSILPTLIGEDAAGHEQEMHDYLYWEYRSGSPRMKQAVRMGKWKGVKPHQQEPFELYNLEADVSETNDVSAQHPQISKQIQEYMDDAHEPPRPQIEPARIEGQDYR